MAMNECMKYYDSVLKENFENTKEFTTRKEI